MDTRRHDKLLGPGWLRSRLPTLLFEAGLVVFAIEIQGEAP